MMPSAEQWDSESRGEALLPTGFRETVEILGTLMQVL